MYRLNDELEMAKLLWYWKNGGGLVSKTTYFNVVQYKNVTHITVGTNATNQSESLYIAF